MVESTSRWARLVAADSPVIAEVAAAARDYAGRIEPHRFGTWVAAWAAASPRLRTSILIELGVSGVRGMTADDVRRLRLVAIPYGRQGCRCHPDLALLADEAADVRVVAVIEAKGRARAAINWVRVSSLACSASELPAAILARVDRGEVDQLTVYRHHRACYDAAWVLDARTVYVIVSPGAGYAAPEGWVAADAERIVEHFLGAAELQARPEFAVAVGAYIAQPGTRPWRAATARGAIRAYARLTEARSWDLWYGRLRTIWMSGFSVALGLTERGWMPVTHDGAPLEPASVDARTLAAYDRALADAAERAGWAPCGYCGAAAAAACGHLDAVGSSAADAPALALATRE